MYRSYVYIYLNIPPLFPSIALALYSVQKAKGVPFPRTLVTLPHHIMIYSPTFWRNYCPFALNIQSKAKGFEGDSLTANFQRDGTIADWYQFFPKCPSHFGTLNSWSKIVNVPSGPRHPTNRHNFAHSLISRETMNTSMDLILGSTSPFNGLFKRGDSEKPS
jgi:hypothetical protein